jgi:hypothetical protein
MGEERGECLWGVLRTNTCSSTRNATATSPTMHPNSYNTRAFRFTHAEDEEEEEEEEEGESTAREDEEGEEMDGREERDEVAVGWDVSVLSMPMWEMSQLSSCVPTLRLRRLERFRGGTGGGENEVEKDEDEEDEEEDEGKEEAVGRGSDCGGKTEKEREDDRELVMGSGMSISMTKK